MHRRLLRLAVLLFILSSFLSLTPPGVPVGASDAATTGTPQVQARGPSGGRGTAALSAEASGAAGRKHWKERLDNIVGGRPVGVSVRLGNSYLYNWDAKQRRAPASNEKLLMSMALFDAIDPASKMETKVAAHRLRGRKIVGDLWLIGRGDPSLTGGGSYGKSLPFPATRISSLARKVKKLGVARITGSVRGAISYFSHDWFAPGWKSDFPAEEIPLPAALSFEGNTAGERHISDPELRAARSLTRRLRAIGVRVAGGPAAGGPPQGLTTVATVRSVPLARIVRFANVNSINYFAEMLGKQLAVLQGGTPGTIAKGAAAIEAWASSRGVTVVANDSSGLSYSNRVAPKGMVRLLETAATEPWGGRLRSTLATGNQGTLEGRLHGVRLRAKTGTLVGHSALSGYVFLRRLDTWASFSIISGGMEKATAVDIEDRIVTLLEKRAN